MKKEFLIRRLIIHRGVINRNVVENTMPAIIKCISDNYALEIDIHILSDNKIVVYHDYNLKRLCGVDKIIETLSYEQLLKYKIKNKYTILTLEQVIHIVDGKVPLLIEIKDINKNNKFEEQLVNILDNYNGEFAIMSFNPYVIKWYNKYRKNYLKGIIIYNNLNYKIIKKTIKIIDFICINKNSLPFKYKTNKYIIGWTINSEKELCKYKELCNNLICENII